MNGPNIARMILLRVVGLLLAASWASVLLAEEPPTEAPDPIRSLRAEATTARTLFSPTQPIPVRFTLFNPTGEAIEIPVVWTDDERNSVTLPRGVIFGTDEQPALSVSYENEKPVPVRPDSTGTGENPADVLRLAPHASVGAEIDLSAAHRLLRYSGSYRLEWQPLGGHAGPATVSFRVEPRKDAVLVTDYGKITFSLMYDKAPRNVENFLELVRDRFYDGKTIHRVVPGFIVQGGSPDGTPTGIRPDGKLVIAEFHGAPFEVGTLALARKPSDPHSASCQFFITLGRLPELDGKYTVIGQAGDEESVRTLQQIAELPTDGDGRPLRPLMIRFFTLVDTPATEPRPAESR